MIDLDLECGSGWQDWVFLCQIRGQMKSPPSRDGHELPLRSNQIRANRDLVQPVDQMRMRQSLAVSQHCTSQREGKEEERGRQTRDSQICLPIFDVFFGQYSGEFRTKIPVHFDAIKPGTNQGRDENPHVVGGNTEYLSTMRKFWVARLGEGMTIRIEYEQRQGLPPLEGSNSLSMHENRC